MKFPLLFDIYLDSESLLWESSLCCTQYVESGDLFSMIMFILKTMSNAPVVIVVVLLTMIALTASCYSYHKLGDNK